MYNRKQNYIQTTDLMNFTRPIKNKYQIYQNDNSYITGIFCQFQLIKKLKHLRRMRNFRLLFDVIVKIFSHVINVFQFQMINYFEQQFICYVVKLFFQILIMNQTLKTINHDKYTE